MLTSKVSLPTSNKDLQMCNLMMRQIPEGSHQFLKTEKNIFKQIKKSGNISYIFDSIGSKNVVRFQNKVFKSSVLGKVFCYPGLLLNELKWCCVIWVRGDFKQVISQESCKESRGPPRPVPDTRAACRP